MADLKVTNFGAGVNNVAPDQELGAEAMRSIQNMDILNSGTLRRRDGYSQADAQGGHSLFSLNDRLYFASGASLYSWQKGGSPEAIAPVQPNAPLRYEEINGFLYVTDGRNGYRIDGNSVAAWGVETPAGLPNVSTIGVGNLPEGDYLIAFTYLRGREESAASDTLRVTLDERGSIVLSNLPFPTDVDVTEVSIYCSNTSGETLYKHTEVLTGTSSFVIATLPTSRTLDTLLMDVLPAGQALAHYRGRLFSAVGGTVYFSEPLLYGLYKPTDNFIEFAGSVNMLLPVDNGLFIGAGDRTYFLSGETPDQFSVRIVVAHGVVDGAYTRVPANAFAFDGLDTGFVATWWSKSGNLIVGLPQGQIQVVRDAELALPEYTSGNIITRNVDGATQLLSSLSEPKRENALAASDSVSATVYRNGIEL